MGIPLHQHRRGLLRAHHDQRRRHGPRPRPGVRSRGRHRLTQRCAPWRTYEIADERLITLGDDHAILVYTGRAYRDEDEPAFIALMSSVYTRREGSWRLALYQQTPVPAQP
ncbi:hypothetical protein [Microbacterium elymi]|uniref:DUF4440 domain-containing protein n=1 Tax=Microbacterium elymi TaxID=2909587 RepID=A0ABY5NJ00_9MICO|nr:hypothetical protein [Microbacterium elymi]UUT35152.1 hypothetical protein L2X98_33435 [Microbacterium elymi]